MATDSDQTSFSLALRFIEIHTQAIVQYIDGNAKNYIAWIVKDHESAAHALTMEVFFKDTITPPEPTYKSYLKGVGVDLGRPRYHVADSDVSYELRNRYTPVPHNERRTEIGAFQEAVRAVIAIFFLRWQYRFQLYIECDTIALQETIEILSNQTPPTPRQLQWFEVARNIYFKENSDQEERARQSGWYEWVTDEKTVAYFLERHYRALSPFHWMWRSLTALQKAGWTEDEKVAS